MGIGPSTKETSLHHFRDPLLEVVSEDTDLDLLGLIIVGTPDDNKDKMLVGTRAAAMAECMRADGVIISSDGWGNSDVDYTNTCEQLGIRGIPVTGLNFSGTVAKFVVVNDYLDGTIACVEGAKFQTLQGIARIGKGLEQISGDTFLMKDLPGGRKGIALSDGMGSGEEAFRDSTMVVEMLEELLEAGFPVETAVQMMNTALVIGREEVKFCTLDVCLFDLYRGSCEFVKAGAAATFIKKKDKVEKIVSTTLPIGVIQNIEIDREVCDLESGDYVVMVTDGVLDALPAKEQEEQMIDIIQNTNIVNPTEFARSILSEVLKYSGEMPLDDMTILVIGLWGVS